MERIKVASKIAEDLYKPLLEDARILHFLKQHQKDIDFLKKHASDFLCGRKHWINVNTVRDCFNVVNRYGEKSKHWNLMKADI